MTTIEGGHLEEIECPECKVKQIASVLHKCNYCGFLIGESEWEATKPSEDNQLQK